MKALAFFSCLLAPLALAQTTASGLGNFTFDELWNLQVNFLNNYTYPNNVIQAESINSTLFAEDVKGRVDITRTFDGRELNTEYMFGLFANLAANPDALSLLGVPLSYEIVQFAANEYITSATARIMFNFTSLNIMVPVEVDLWHAWNDQGQVLQYDATFKWFAWLLDFVVQSSLPLFQVNTTTAAVGVLTDLLAQSICATATQFCVGDNLQYNSADSCYQYLTQDVRFGEAYELGRNTLLCRMVHQNMVPYRPGVHCPHIGPSGGGYCTDDMTYDSTVDNNYFTTPFVPYGY
ncbi:hypothetical protein F5884DRAFT_23627 [Xylogone sp. PMI_703]|nr:hypothetical protein F5884DRAFT_23627 [Xylogone sp. PMI_703]